MKRLRSSRSSISIKKKKTMTQHCVVGTMTMVLGTTLWRGCSPPRAGGDILREHLRLLRKQRRRMERVGVRHPTVEVRWRDVSVDADCHVVSGKKLATLLNAVRQMVADAVGWFRFGRCSQQHERIRILNDVSGILKPSRLTLLLGPPGCGKTTLLLAPAGKLNKNLKVMGEVGYNGVNLNTFVPDKISAYISQYDEMTVRETLDFSARFQGVGTRAGGWDYPEPDIDTYMKIMGLDICADIIVGDVMRRGISGGEKRRLTKGEMIVGPSRALFIDEISTGLDSSTTFQIISCFQQLCHISESTILVSLLQPAPQTYELFDDIILMAEGKIVLSKKDQQQYWSSSEETYKFFIVDNFCDKFKASQDGPYIAEELSKPYDKLKGHKNPLSFNIYSLSKWDLLKSCFPREILLMRRNAFVYITKTIQLFILFLVHTGALSLFRCVASYFQRMVAGTIKVVDASHGRKILLDRGLEFPSYFYWISVGALIGFIFLFNVAIGTSRAIISRGNLVPYHGTAKDKFKDMDNKMTNPRTPNSTGRMVLPFTPLTISFRNVNYYVDTPVEMREQGYTERKLQLLHNITGAFQAGILSALMGVTVAGKTILLDVLAGRKTGGFIDGDIRVGGYPKVQQTFARISGNCEQIDVHSPQITVGESVTYSAWLHFPIEIDSKTRKEFVNEVLQTIELEEIGDSLVGLPGVNGLSTEQRKWLTIAVELVSNPLIIFMDEPTSGLDARAAAIVIRAVKNIAETGRTVVCTIHQPSIEIFEAFDELMLMKRGGELIYAGPLGHHSCNVIQYFQAIPGVPKIKDNYNPSTWMLEVTCTLGEDFAQIYRESSMFQDMDILVKNLSKPPLGTSDLHFPTQFPQKFGVQLKVCLWKQCLSYWRSPSYNMMRIIFMIISCINFGALFWQKGNIKNIND
uniref:ABC transporter domain-containing protein n=1 Tax=Leersia perrieri TaxID=77586 RepID=A0A0D9XY53_9ORYZ